MKSLFVLQIILYILGGVAGLSFERNKTRTSVLTHLLAAAGGGVGVLYSLVALRGQNLLVLNLPGFALFGNLRLEVDPLSAFFIFVISFLSIATSIFAIGYSKEFKEKSVGFLGFLYNFFILTMILVVAVRNAFYFLIFWELMSLVSYFLVVSEHEKPEARRAGILYLVMTHAGTAFISIAFLALFANSGSFSFDDFVKNAPSLSSVWKNTIFICALIGFGTKAGMIPLHIWLPEAHPQAPSHVSALMSGVMIKTAIYALLRFIFNFLGSIPSWWGSLILVLGIASTLLGILYALMEHDLKRLLAFSSIENIGIILLGIGAATFLAASHHLPFASFALIASLYHVLNHAVFKGLLFLGAGSVLSATHTRDMESLGGLIKNMPWTAACFLVGSVAISALPPLNGFVSEWMTFIALLSGFQCEGLGIRFFSPILASLLGLAGALAAMCFVKAFGVTFLGAPRSSHSEHAQEVSFSMKMGMMILALSCFFFAVAAPSIVSRLGKLSAALIGSEVPSSYFGRGSFLLEPSGLGQFSPWFALGVFVAILMSLLVLGRLGLKERPIQIGSTWDCGVPNLSPRMQYSATGYSKPLRRIFSFLYQPTRRVEVEDEGHELLRTAQRFESKIRPLFEEVFYRPVAKLVFWISEKAKQIQTGHIQLYLSYIFVTLIVLLLLVRLT